MNLTANILEDKLLGKGEEANRGGDMGVVIFEQLKRKVVERQVPDFFNKVWPLEDKSVNKIPLLVV